MGRRRGSAIDRAARALSAAGSVAHLAFFTLYAWRIVQIAGMARVGNVLLAATALGGLATNFVGWSLLRHGGRLKAKKLGLMAVALSTALAAVLLVFAAFTG